MQIMSSEVEPPVTMESRLRSLLASALEEEVTMLENLREIFVAQRRALAAGDPTALDDGVFAATRVMRTLDEARRRRRGITASLVGGDVDADELDIYLTGSATRPVRVARERLRAAAERLREEVNLLRRILQSALSDNRRYLDALLGDAGAGSIEGRNAYPRIGSPTSASDTGIVLDRTV